MVNLSKPTRASWAINKARSLHPITLLITILISAMIVALLWWFWRNFEQVTSTDYALKPETQYNSYYAVELLLNTKPNRANSDASDDGIATTLLDSDLKYLIDNLPDIDEQALAKGYRPTLIINSIGTKLTDARFDALRVWIEQGGHLITFAASGSDDSDMQAALERLQTLQTQQSDPTIIANDELLNELLAKLESGNAFLNKLGIFRVYAEDDEVETEVTIEDLVNEAQSKNNDADKTNAKSSTVKENINNLKEYRPLSVIESQDKLLMIKVPNFDDYLDSHVFQAFYPNSADINQQKYNNNTKQQADLIRQYISQSNSILKHSISKADSKINSNTTKTQTSKTDPQSDKPLATLLPAILALSDEALLALFYPADKLYIDAMLGKGRLSVINDNEAFGNPDPNIELIDNKDVEQKDLAPSSALYNLLTIDGYSPTSLLSADNASWLLSLTQDSSEVWILPNTDVDPLPLMLWKQARFAVLGLGLLTLLWLWSLYNRFGKMAQLSTDQSRDIMRYFRQVGRFGWHQDYAQLLTKATSDKVRLLINEQLDNANTTDSDTGVNTSATQTLSRSPFVINEQYFIKLHDLLMTRVHHKKRALTHVNDSAQSRLNDSIDDSDHLLLANEDFIRQTISLDRLQKALDGQSQSHDQAYAFTQMTQTLWMIQWLLK